MGCPFYQYGEHYVPDIVNENSTVYVIAQNPGDNEMVGAKFIETHWMYGEVTNIYEEVYPQPLIGRTGLKFNEEFLPLSGLTRDQISVGNAIRCRPGECIPKLRADELPTLTNKMRLTTSETDIVKALKHCKEAHLHLPKSTRYIVAMGAYALFQLTGVHGITEWRGYAIDTTRDSITNNRIVDTSVYHSLGYNRDQIIVLPTMHIAALFKGVNKRYYRAVLQDFVKLGRLIKGKWPKPLPTTWNVIAPAQWPMWSSFDTEYFQETNELIRWSLCDTNYNLYCIEAQDVKSNIPVLPGSVVLAQNILADIDHLKGIIDFSQVRFHDLMLADSVLNTGQPHSLNFIASISGAFNRYKHLAEYEPELYSTLDAYEPMYIWKNSVIPEFRRHPPSWKVYLEKTIKLVNIIDKSQKKGIPLQQDKLEIVITSLQDRIEEIIIESREIANDPKFNIGGSKKLKELIYGREGY